MSDPIAAGSVLAARTWTMADQEAFARATGDVNPMHMDSLAARRTQAGAAAVHGVHAALWALEAAAAVRPFGDLAGLQLRFERFVLVGDPTEVVVQEAGHDRLRLVVNVRGTRALTLAALFGPRREGTAGPARAAMPIPERAVELELGEIAACAGAMTLREPAALGSLVPALSRAVGLERVATLGGLSTLVGMIVPGLHSILSKIEITLLDGTVQTLALDYAVVRVQSLLRMIVTTARGPGAEARVESFVRRPPVAQPSLETLRARVAPGAFAGVSALVIGGSRGLGEVTAKLLAAGGAEVAITYVSGRAEAEAVAGAIEAGGGRCRAYRYDAARPAAEQLTDLVSAPTQLYHFASPRIFRQKFALLEPDCLDEMMRVYNLAFYDLTRHLLAMGTRLAAFYPSSVALDEAPKDVAEYVMAKAAGEALAGAMARQMPGLSVLVERLPRTETDQTATVLPMAAAPAADVMMPIVRRMAELSGLRPSA